MYDVVIAGGGPAGLCAARAAARAGARVVVCERDAAFGIPTRTSGGSFVADIRAMGVPEELYNVVRTVRFLGPTTSATVRLGPADVCVLDVRALYQWLAEGAAAAGAELRLRSTVERASVEAARLSVTVRQPGGGETLAARFAVDATGTAAVLARSTGMHAPFARRAVGVEVDMAAPTFPHDTCFLIVGEHVAPAGYAWAFPYRPGRVRVGCGVIRPDSEADPRRLLDQVLDLPELRDALDGAQPIERHAGLIPVEPLRTAVVQDGIVCIGDAASHASTLVGEGIRYAMAAGEAAGTALGEALRAGGDEAPLRAFERHWRRRFGRDFAVAYRINRALAAFDDAHWDRAVAALQRTPPWFVVSALSTRFRARDLARLAAGHPGLALSFLRAAR
ncbi:MAG: NAD(P)/FAD-dependent oxidoreductase [Chloroflexi bacterium]|nr:MAG: NAD(P)/FAD-dependent oxidoreductase [Chloroflexota bacterium]